MSISEADISILIPTYRYREKVGRALDSALASAAGEIIVTDDHSGDGTMKLLERYSDARLRVYENARNLGLWENHLEALNHSTKPWIKFLQADDYLLPGGLAVYAAMAGPDVSLVWSCAVVRDDETGAVMQYNNIASPRLVEGDLLLEACLYLGWVLGSPSHMLIRADAIERDPAAWATEISADVVMGAVAAAQGSVVLLPPGAICQGAHPHQDAKTQGSHRGLRRLVATSAYLQARPEPALRRFATLWAAMNSRSALRTAMNGILRRRISLLDAYRLLYSNACLANGANAEHELLNRARTYRRRHQIPHDVAAVLNECVARSERAARCWTV